MNSFTLLLVCAQALFIQNAFGQYNPAPVCTAPAPAYAVPAPAYAVPAPAYEVPVPACAIPAPAYEVPVPVCAIPAPAYAVPAPEYVAPAPYLAGPAPAIPTPGLPWGGGYGIKVSGDNLAIDGQAQVSGSIPFASSVQLDGDVPAEGAATLRNACLCGDAYLR